MSINSNFPAILVLLLGRLMVNCTELLSPGVCHGEYAVPTWWGGLEERPLCHTDCLHAAIFGERLQLEEETLGAVELPPICKYDEGKHARL